MSRRPLHTSRGGTDITYVGYSDRMPCCVSGGMKGQDWGTFVLLLGKR